MARILIVDDEPGMRQVMSKILTPLGHQITGADEGVRAVQMAKELQPDIALLDIRLPDMDGPDILAAFKKTKENLPVIVLSGFGDVDAAAELVRLGAFAYISKPFKVNELVDVVNRALSKLNPSAPSAGAPRSAAQTYAAASYLKSARNTKSGTGFLAGAALGVALLAAGGFFAWKTYFEAPSAEFKIPYSNASGICFDGTCAWISDWADESVYRHSLEPGFKVVAAYKKLGTAITGICFDGANIWTTSSLDQQINRHKLDASLTIEASFKSPGPSPTGLCYDGKNIWSADYQSAKLYRHKMDGNLSVEAAYDIPAENPCGMFARGEYIYVADAKTSRVYKLSADTLFLAAIYELPGYGGQNKRLASIAFDGKSIWTCASGLDAVYRHKFSDLKEVKF